MSNSSFSETSQAEAALAEQPRRWLIWPWVALAVAVGLLIGYRSLAPAGRPDMGANHPSVAARIEQFDLLPLTGDAQRLSLADLQGKVSLVNFWGPWCHFCVVEFPHLVELEQHFRDDDHFQLLSVSCSGDAGSDEDMGPETARFLEQQGAKFPTYRDPDLQTRTHLAEVARLGGMGYPMTFVIDAHGVIQGVWEGYTPGDERQMRTVVEQALREAHQHHGHDHEHGPGGGPGPASGPAASLTP